jgi:outer membrane murein-binding lipoprotein Lpp
MIHRRVALSLVLPGVLVFAAAPARGQEAKADDLAGRVQQLERRVTELEARVRQLQAHPKDPARTGVAAQLVGTWVIAEEDRKADGLFTDLRLRADGTGKAAINRPDGQWNSVKYDVVGRQLQVRDERGAVAYALSARIASISDAELVLEYSAGDKTRQAKYTREK